MSSLPAQFLLASAGFTPAYLELGAAELERRAAEAQERLRSCELCPRACRANRLEDRAAVCLTGRYARVSSFFPHQGEEDCLRGWNGSGTIFFAGCSLRCIFCQNYDVSHFRRGRLVDAAGLARMMVELQEQGCHNVNLVTPEHVVPQIVEALPRAIAMGLRLPLVYNTSGYDSLASLQLLDGLVDVYMPDFKLWDPDLSRLYLRAPDYPEVARQAIREMHRQVGDLQVDEHGLAKRGVLLRHLVMPGNSDDTRHILRWIAQELSPHTYVNVMAQYRPLGKVGTDPRYDAINRVLLPEEYEQALRTAHEADLYRLDSPLRRDLRPR